MKTDFRDWSDVRVFLAVVRAGSTLAASRTLGLAQPTVARRIDALEHALGLVLFERDTRGFQPTPEAQALIEQAQALEVAAKGFAEKAGRLIAGRTRTIRITSFQDTFNHRFSSVIEAFISTYGDVQFEFLASEERLDIAAGQVDVAIRAAQTIDDPTLICCKIRETGISLYASKAYAAKRPLPKSESEFGGHKFVVYEGRLATFNCHAWVRARIDPGQIVMAVDNLNAMQAAVLMGAGIGPWPTRVGSSNDKVIACFALPPEAAIQTWFLVNPAAYRRPEVKAFTAFFVPHFRAALRESQDLKPIGQQPVGG